MAKQSTTFDPLVWLNRVVAIALFGIAIWFVLGFFLHRPIAFESERWKDARNTARFDIRYRMKDDLLSRLERRETPSRDHIEELLGPSERGNPESRIIGYVIGRKHIGPIPYHGYYMRLVFDEDETLVEARVVGE